MTTLMEITLAFAEAVLLPTPIRSQSSPSDIWGSWDLSDKKLTCPRAAMNMHMDAGHLIMDRRAARSPRGLKVARWPDSLKPQGE